MMRIDLENTRIAISRLLRDLDPRTVKLRDPRPRIRPWIVLALVSAALVAGAAALAATTGGEEPRSGDEPEATGPTEYAPIGPIAAEPHTAPADDRSRRREEAPPPPKRHPNFHDPVYVFTEGQVGKVTAYPLADPPGLVVNLDGAPEPTASPESMVGEDSRVRAIRRRVTDEGVRYVLGLTIPVKRIDVLHEGNVVIITPIK
jgi:hypothetical protein